MKPLGKIWIVGIGPGDRALMTPQAVTALRHAHVAVGYSGYLDSLKDLLSGKECQALALGQEAERAQRVLDEAAQGRSVCLISSGDAGIYGMASVLLESMERVPESDRPEVEIVPGVSALQAGASLLGAPLGHDFAVISLSDLLTPWEVIEKRLRAVAEADFVVALFNPKSQRRDWQLPRAQEIFLQHRSPETPVGMVRQAYRPEQSVEVTTLSQMAIAKVDMFSLLYIGNSASRQMGRFLYTPRGYRL